MSTDIMVESGVSENAEEDLDEEEVEELEETFVIHQPNETGDNNVVNEEKDDDKTEDQVPDISGTENVADLMTISVDEVEDIPVIEEDGNVEEEKSTADVPDQLENDLIEVPVVVASEETVANNQEESPAEEPTNEEVAANDVEQTGELIQVEVLEENTEEVPQEQEEAENVQDEEAEPTAVEPVDGELQEIPVDVAPEEAVETQEVEEVEEVVIESEEPEEQQEQEQQQQQQEDEIIQLQDPPTPKRPRTPNELDAPVNLTEVEVVEVTQLGSQPQTPKSPIKNSQPGTPTVNVVGSVPQTPKSPGSVRRTSNVSATPKSPLPNGTVLPGTPLANGSVQPGTPRSAAAVASPKVPKTEFVFEEASPVQTPKSPKKINFDEEILSTASSKSKSRSPSKSPPKSPRSPRKKVRKFTKSPEPEAEVAEPEVEPEAEAEVAAENADELANGSVNGELEETPAADANVTSEEVAAEPEPTQTETVTTETVEEPRESSPVSSPRRARVQSPSPPPRATTHEPVPRDYVPYDQDSHHEHVPARLPTSTSFSSWVAPEPKSYEPISPWVNKANKYSNEHTTGLPPVHTSSYVSIFDDLVNSGPFSHSLYSTSRLLERSRSRTRERRNALRSQRSASNYYRFASQLPPPLRTRDYSTPPTSTLNKPPSRAGSFISFLEYSNSKQYDLTRNYSRGSLYDSNHALSRCSSRGNIDYYLGAGRISRVDSYVNNLNSRYEWQVPSNYETYRSSSRSHIGYAPLNQYASFTNSLYEENPRTLRNTVNPGRVRNLYEGRIDELQRSLSRERFERDRLRSKYTQVAYQLEQAVKQMDLLRSNGYSSLRSGSQPRTSVYTHFYPPVQKFVSDQRRLSASSAPFYHLRHPMTQLMNSQEAFTPASPEVGLNEPSEKGVTRTTYSQPKQISSSNLKCNTNPYSYYRYFSALQQNSRNNSERVTQIENPSTNNLFTLNFHGDLLKKSQSTSNIHPATINSTEEPSNLQSSIQPLSSTNTQLRNRASSITRSGLPPTARLPSSYLRNPSLRYNNKHNLRYPTPPPPGTQHRRRTVDELTRTPFLRPKKFFISNL